MIYTYAVRCCVGHCHKSAGIKESECTETDTRHQLGMSTGIGEGVHKYGHTATPPPCYGSMCMPYRLPALLESRVSMKLPSGW